MLYPRWEYHGFGQQQYDEYLSEMIDLVLEIPFHELSLPPLRDIFVGASL